MITRIGRLLRGELLKLRMHPFFFWSIAFLFVGTEAGGYFSGEGSETVWRAHHAVASFAGAAKVGLKLATFMMLVFGSLMFAGEFDRGTIKVLLTRPVTRTDVFVAKALALVLLSCLFIGIVLYVSAARACMRGELGPVWDDASYTTSVSHATLMAHTRKAVAMSIAAVVAAGFLGLLISNCTESSGFAVAITLTLFFVVDEVAVRMFHDDQVRRLFFNHYPTYAFDVLRDYALGSSAKWKEAFDRDLVYLWVPGASMLAFFGTGYTIFRRRNITA